jgi:demethylmenaquinone methyltransferase/2-methoxy-6-polyprenyl-1,4-benzoquinol methylase
MFYLPPKGLVTVAGLAISMPSAMSSRRRVLKPLNEFALTITCGDFFFHRNVDRLPARIKAIGQNEARGSRKVTTRKVVWLKEAVRQIMQGSEKLDLKEHIASKEKKQRYVNRLFETIASRYDFFTSFMSYGMDRRWKRTLVEMLKLQGNETALDIACGTGDITFMLARKLTTGAAVGLDITQKMLEIAERKRSNEKLSNVAFNRGDIIRMPFEDETFDCVTAGYALRNVPDVAAAIREIKRVLKPGGRLLSLDFGHPPNRIYRLLYLGYLSAVGASVGWILHRDADTYRYIPETLKLYPGQRGIREMMTRAGFVDTGFRQFGGGIMAINYGAKPR